MHVKKLIPALPKAELHNHLVGSASPETVLSLALRHPGAGVPTSVEALRNLFVFRDFAHFIEIYMAVDALVTTPEDIADLVFGAARDAAASNVRWLELTVELGFIIDISAEKGIPHADLTIDFLTRHAPDGTVAIGVAGMEAGFPRSRYADHVAQARALGLPAVVHAGESTGPQTVWSALRDLNAVRIGHGTHAFQDEELVQYLVDHAIPLEVCITSNVCTNSVPSLQQHPVVGYLERGVRVSLATDDAGMFATTLNREYELLASIAEVSPADIVRIVQDGVAVSLAPDRVKAALLDQISRVAAEHSG